MAKHFSAFAIVLLLGWGGLKTGKTLPRAGRGPDSSERTAEIMKAQQRD